MNQEEFGRLLFSLRRERTSGIGRNFLSQEKFAETVNIAKVRYGRFEQGTRKPRIDELVRIAENLQLTSRERQEFMIAGLQLDDEALNKNIAEPNDVLEDLLRKMNGVRTPFIIFDSFATIIALNRTVIHFYSGKESVFNLAKQDPAYANYLNVLFSEHIPEARATLKDIEDDFLAMNIRFFRGITFRYRHMPFYDKIIKHLKQHKRFEKYWNKTLYLSNDDYDFVRDNKINHPFLGDIHFLRLISMTNTSAGPLYTLIYLPANDTTDLAFRNHLINTDNQLMKVAQNWSWPEYMKQP